MSKEDLDLHFKDAKVLVIGLGVSGRSAADFLLAHGANAYGVDSNRELLGSKDLETLRQKGLKIFHESEELSIKGFKLVVASPGVSPKNRFYEQAIADEIEVIGEVELACRFLKGCFLGITGTNGKTTVTMLVTHVLNESGVNAKALGNVGVPITSGCPNEERASGSSDEKYVVELSSYQLDTMRSRCIDAAVILNITPDHLDRYQTMDEYARSKMHIADCLKPNGILYVEEKCYREYGCLLAGFTPMTYGYSSTCDLYTDKKHLIYHGQIECTLPPQYIGKVSHDLENLMASYALCRHAGVTPEQFIKAIASFKKPAHRIEFVREHNGVRFYDDSKGTNIDAVIRAVDTFTGSIILIAGGVDKGAAYTPWIAAFANKVKCVCAIGQAAIKIKQDLAHAIPVILCKSLDEAVAYASCRAEQGETVLLSPGCSSFDMFRDYAHRGHEFQRLVKNLS